MTKKFKTIVGQLMEHSKDVDIELLERRYEHIFRRDVDDDPLRRGLDFTLREKKECLVVDHAWFTVIYPDARWFRALRFWEQLKRVGEGE